MSVSSQEQEQSVIQPMTKLTMTTNKRNLFLQQWHEQSKDHHFLLLKTALLISFTVSILLASVLPAATAKSTLILVQQKFHTKLTKLTFMTLTNLVPTIFLCTQAAKCYPFLLWSGFINTVIWGIPLWLGSEFLFSTVVQTVLISYLQPKVFFLKSTFPSVFVPWLRQSRLLLTPKTRQLCRLLVEVLAVPLAELLFIRRRVRSMMQKVEFDEEKKEKKSSLLTAYFFTALITAAAMKTIRAWITLSLSREELSVSTLLLSAFNPTTDLIAVVVATAMWKRRNRRQQSQLPNTKNKSSSRLSMIKALFVAFALRAVAAVCGMKPLHHWLTLISSTISSSSKSSLLLQYSSTLLLIMEFSKVIWTGMMLVACLHVVYEISGSLPLPSSLSSKEL